MIDHTGIRVSSFERSKAFYQKALAPLGYRLQLEFKQTAGFRAAVAGKTDDPGGDFWITGGEPFTPRSHIAFRAGNRDEVNAFYTAAIAAGGRDNGAPEVCSSYHAHYYAGFVHDPDGYNIEAVCHKKPLEAS
jgi:catechol 2,3-dioxygenase-like lactoylglutathione lyase family enzyme